MKTKRNPMNVHGRTDELILDAKSVIRSRTKWYGTAAPKDVDIYVTTSDHFQTYKVVDIHDNGVDVIYEIEGQPPVYAFYGWSSLIPYTIFTIIKILHYEDVRKILGK